jgi:hypothetical protein
MFQIKRFLNYLITMPLLQLCFKLCDHVGSDRTLSAFAQLRGDWTRVPPPNVQIIVLKAAGNGTAVSIPNQVDKVVQTTPYNS